MSELSMGTATTADELLRLATGDGRYELIGGDLREMPPAGAEHGSVALRIGALLDRHVAERGAGRTFAAETGFLLTRDPDTVRAPDVAYVARERAEAAGHVIGYWPGAPDLAVEVVSPGDSYSDLHDKALVWLEAGTALVVVADPASRRVTVYRAADDVRVLSGDRQVDCGPVLPGFAPEVESLFP
jgi:Uma2 family endonuclease